ncbi:MAG: hypothetical protein VYB09_07290 [Planctomycetota bacterium]|nr:hypothetical protein [Planctomycetota bacterium]
MSKKAVGIFIGFSQKQGPADDDNPLPPRFRWRRLPTGILIMLLYQSGRLITEPGALASTGKNHGSAA